MWEVHCIQYIFTMKFSASAAAAVLLLGGSTLVESFSTIQSSAVSRTVSSSSRRMASSDNDFDSILGEGASYQEAANNLQNAASSSSTSPVIRIPDGSPAATVTLTSSVAASDIYGDDLAFDDEDAAAAALSPLEGGLVEEEAVAASDPLLNNEILKRQHEKKVKREQRRASGGMMRYVKNPLLLVKGKDFSDVTLTILIPAFVSYLAIKKVSDIGFGKLAEKADKLYEQGAYDIAYHVGDYEAMESTYKDYKKKLWFNGAPSYINSELVKRLAIAFATQISITPKSVSSLAYLLTMMNIPDDEAAEQFVTVCRENPQKMAIASKVLFYSEHVFKDESAKKKMAPLIKNLAHRFGDVEAVMDLQRYVVYWTLRLYALSLINKLILPSCYQSSSVLCLMTVSEMGESAYRDAVAEAGPGQTKMTEGWKVLGLDKETATKIFEETKALGFLSREELWEKEELDIARAEFEAEERARQELRDSIDKDGNLIDPNDDIDPDKRITDEDLNKFKDDDDDDDESAGPPGAKECGNCGYTLFIAKGREGKFFSSSFKCPECGAARDQFKDVDIDV